MDIRSFFKSKSEATSKQVSPNTTKGKKAPEPKKTRATTKPATKTKTTPEKKTTPEESKKRKIENPDKVILKGDSDEDFQSSKENISKKKKVPTPKVKSPLQEKDASKTVPTKETAVSQKAKSPQQEKEKMKVSPKQTKARIIESDEEVDVMDLDKELDEIVSPPKVKPKKPSPAKEPAKKRVSTKKTGSRSTNISALEIEKLPPKPKQVPAEPQVEEIQPEKPKSTPHWVYTNNRIPPPNKGLKEVPVGKPFCLAGKDFLVTGILDSLEREEAYDLVKQYGGTVSKSVTKKLTHVVIGIDAGESKLAKIKSNPNITMIDEDGLFELIRTLPEGKPLVEKSPKKRISKTDSVGPALTLPVPLKPLTASQFVKHDSSSMSKEESDYSGHSMLWQDKYRPRSTQDLIGNVSFVSQIKTWLQTWNPEKKTEKAVLISGPPGIGKTSSAVLIAKECGFEPLEFNASDKRNKSSLGAVVAQATDNRSLGEFWAKGTDVVVKPKRTCIIMDEVDGMSGNEDRGGTAELIQMIKKSKVPIICICNDRYNTKIRSLANYCRDVRFKRPAFREARNRLLEISRQEAFIMDDLALSKIFDASHGDIRQALSMLQMFSLAYRDTSLHGDLKLKDKLESFSKNVDLGPFDVVPKIFAGTGSVLDRVQLYFVDYAIIPLFVQENYLSVNQILPANYSPVQRELAQLNAMSAAAESISDGDLVDKMIHSGQHWELQNVHGVLSTVRPASIMKSTSLQMNFPTWLSKNSTTNKNYRLLREVTSHMSTVITGDKIEVRMQYLPVLKNMLVKPLIEKGLDGVQPVIDIMDSYDITRDDWESVIELVDLTKSDILSKIPPNVKTAFTKTYNKHHHAIRVAPSSVKKSKSKDDEDIDDISGTTMEEEGKENEEVEEEEDVASDKMIKVKSAKGKKESKATAKRSKATTKASKARAKK